MTSKTLLTLTPTGTASGGRSVANGDATLSRRRRPFLERIFGGIILNVLGLFVRFGRFERFSPDLYINVGFELSCYGFDAKALHLPGHSRGSVGILTTSGDLFCGDLLWNMCKPATHSIVDDPAEMNASVEKLKSLNINMIHSGHGKPFPMAAVLKTRCQIGVHQ